MPMDLYRSGDHYVLYAQYIFNDLSLSAVSS
jgi:hypothetical protein